MENEQLTKPSQSLADLLAHYPVQKPLNIREQLVEEAFFAINKEREGTKFKPVTKRALAIRVNLSCPTSTDVHYLLSLCRKSKSFGKIFL